MGRVTATAGPVLTARFGPDESPSIRVIEVLAAVTGVEPEFLSPPFAAVVDPDSLDSLVFVRAPSERPVALWFAYREFDVCVRSDGRILVYDPVEPATFGSDGAA